MSTPPGSKHTAKIDQTPSSKGDTQKFSPMDNEGFTPSGVPMIPTLRNSISTMNNVPHHDQAPGRAISPALTNTSSSSSSQYSPEKKYAIVPRAASNAAAELPTPMPFLTPHVTPADLEAQVYYGYNEPTDVMSLPAVSLVRSNSRPYFARVPSSSSRMVPTQPRSFSTPMSSGYVDPTATITLREHFAYPSPVMVLSQASSGITTSSMATPKRSNKVRAWSLPPGLENAFPLVEPDPMQTDRNDALQLPDLSVADAISVTGRQQQRPSILGALPFAGRLAAPQPAGDDDQSLSMESRTSKRGNNTGVTALASGLQIPSGDASTNASDDDASRDSACGTKLSGLVSSWRWTIGCLLFLAVLVVVASLPVLRNVNSTSANPSNAGTAWAPTVAPTVATQFTARPTWPPAEAPVSDPSTSPTMPPSENPTTQPSLIPTQGPTLAPVPSVAKWSQIGPGVTGGSQLLGSNVLGHHVATNVNGTMAAVSTPTGVYVFSVNAAGEWAANGTRINASDIVALDMSQDGTTLAVGERSGAVRVARLQAGQWTINSSSVLALTSANVSDITLSLSSSGQRLATAVTVASLDGSTDAGGAVVQVYDWNGTVWTKVARAFGGGLGDIFYSRACVSLSGDGNVVAVSHVWSQSLVQSGYVRTFTLGASRMDWTPQAQVVTVGRNLAATRLSYRGDVLTTATPEYGSRVYKLDSNRTSWSAAGLDLGPATVVDVTAGFVATGNSGGAVTLWQDVGNATWVAAFRGTAQAFALAGRRLFLLTANNQALVYQAA